MAGPACIAKLQRNPNALSWHTVGGRLLAKVWSAALNGVEAYRVRVEVDVGPGLPSFSVVGLPHGSVREGRDRVMAALRSLGRPVPPRRIVVNLAPADRRKEGSALDLAIALGLMVGAGDVEADPFGAGEPGDVALEDTAFVGELGLDGAVRSMRGALSVADAARTAGLKRIVLPRSNAREAAAIPGIDVVGVATLREAVALLEGRTFRPPTVTESLTTPATSHAGPDLADVRGQLQAKRAVEIAAAGGHALYMIGPPGVGKTMLARRLAPLLPDLADEDAIEVTKVHSVAGLLEEGSGLMRRPPFRAPHHTISDAGLVGGGVPARPGELSLAHGGVLFLDELAEFRRNVLESLRQPLEEGAVRITRAQLSLTFPARVQLVAASNPCPCGFFGEQQGRCLCDERAIARYRTKASGPLLDRFDMHVELAQPPSDVLLRPPPDRSNVRVRKRIEDARGLQRQRNPLRGTDSTVVLNAHLAGPDALRVASASKSSLRALRTSRERLSLSARGVHRVLKVARTIADLQGCESVREAHVAEAVRFRANTSTPLSRV